VIIKGISGVRIFSYFIYALLLTAVLLYVRFPADKFQTFLVRTIESAFPGARVDLGTYHYTFPATFHLDRALFEEKKSEEEIVLLEGIDVTPIISGLGFKYALSAKSYGGSFQANLQLSPVAGSFTLDEIDLNHIDLALSPFLKNISRREVSGYLDYSGIYSSPLDGLGKREAKGVVRLSEGTFSLIQPVLTLRNLDMQSLDVGISFADGVLALVEGSFKGAELHADFEGTITAADGLEAWKVELGGTMVPQKDFMKDKPQVLRVVKRLQSQYRKTALPYRVSGSIGNPRFRFGTN
jgi:type II secretion system protein N